MLTVGIDLGTTGVRAMVYDESCAALGEHYTEYPLITPDEDTAEQDAELWWKLSCEAVRKALAAAGRPAEQVASIGVSSQGISVVPVDGEFRPLRNAISWLDRRPREELAAVLQRFDAGRVYDVTGKRPSALYTLPKLLWLQNREPAVYEAARYFLMPLDFLNARLTGVPVTDRTMASGSMLYDIAGEGWWGEAMDAFGLLPDRLPRLAWGGEVAGTLTDAAAAALGLPGDVTVYVGGQDQKCAAYAAGLGPGMATISLGTSGAIEVLTDSGAPPADDVLPYFAYFMPGKRVFEGVLNTAGMALRWMRDTLAPTISYAALDDLAGESVGRGTVYFLPHLSGEASPGWHTEATGGFQGLTLHSSLADMVCALLEGVVFEVVRNLRAAGARQAALTVFGGGAKSRLWCQMLADCAGVEVRTAATPEMACLGAACLAMGGRAKPAAPQKAYAPNPALAGYYAQKLGRYEQLGDALRPWYR